MKWNRFFFAITQLEDYEKDLPNVCFQRAKLHLRVWSPQMV